MIAGHFCRHQFFAADVAFGKFLTHAGLFIIGQAGHHWSCRHENTGDIAEGGGGHHKAGDDLVTNAKIDCRIKDVMRQADACGQSDHIT